MTGAPELTDVPVTAVHPAPGPEENAAASDAATVSISALAVGVAAFAAMDVEALLLAVTAAGIPA
jgi:hypothetical protein